MFSCLFTLGYLAGGISAAVNASLWQDWADWLDDLPDDLRDFLVDQFNLEFGRIADALGAGAVSEAVFIIKCI